MVVVVPEWLLLLLLLVLPAMVAVLVLLCDGTAQAAVELTAVVLSTAGPAVLVRVGELFITRVLAGVE
jgi:hypothetical protein